MALNEGLSIKLSGDASEFIAELQRAEAAARGFAGNVSSLTAGNNTAATATTNLANAAATASRNLAAAGSTLSAVTSATNRLSPVIGGVSRNMAAAGSTVSTLTNNVNRLSPALNNAATASRNLSNSATRVAPALNNASRASGQAGFALTNLGRVASDAPFGFIAIQNNLDPLIQSFTQLRTSLGSTTAALSALGRSLLGVAGIGLAFTVATAVITKLIQTYGSLGNAIDAIFGRLTDAEKAQKSLDLSIAESSEEYVKATKNVNELRINIGLAKNGFLDKDKVVRQYNDTVGKTTGKVNTLDQAEQALTKNAEAYIRFTLLKAAAQIALGKAAEQAFKVQQELNKTDEQSTSFILSGLKNASDPQTIKLYQKAAARQREVAASEARKSQATFEKIANDLQTDAAKLATAFKFDFFGGEQKPEKQKKNVDEVKKTLDDLSASLVKLDAQFLATGGSLSELTRDKINAFKTAIGSLAEQGILPGTALFDRLKESIQNLQSIITRPIVAKIPITLEPIPSASNAQTIANVLKGVQDTFRPQLNNFTKELNSIIKQSISTGIESISEAIGSALVTGDMSGILKSFALVISGFMSKLGTSLIVTGLALEAFTKSLSSLQGVTAIAAGAALVLAAGAFRSLATGGIGSFATGGQVFGEQLAVVGDNPGRSETIIPSEVLDKLSGNSGAMEVYGIIRGEDIYLSNARAGRNKTRING